MKDLYEEVPREVHFAKTTDSIEAKDDGFMDLRPLDPYIVSGGENTEQFYFKKVSKLTNYHFKVVPEYFGKESEYTEEFPSRINDIVGQNPDAKIFCVFDLDTTIDNTANQIRHEKFEASIQKQIDSGQVILCPSLPCFEYWLLLHFKDITTRMKSNSAVANYLSKYMKPLFPNSDKLCLSWLRNVWAKRASRLRIKKYIPSFLHRFMNRFFCNGKKSFSKMLKSRKYLEKMDWEGLIHSDGNLERAIVFAKKNYENALAAGTIDNQSYTLVFKAFTL